MKKTYNINISGYAFVIDEDAYEMLDAYLSTLGKVCEKAGQRETASDIEQRIAEIFTESRPDEGGIRVISLREVEGVISRMGTPEEILEVEEESGTPLPPPPGGGAAVPPPVPPMRRRLYRDVDHKVIGGVCSGLAWYIGIDVVWIRLIMVLLTLLSATTLVVIYIVLWIAIPPALSPYEKMQMMGVNPSMQNVGKVVTGEYRREESRRGSSNDFGRVIVMILVVLALLIVGALLTALALAFIGCLLALCISPAGGVSPEMTETRLILGTILGGSLVAGLPLLLLFRLLLAKMTERPLRRLTPQQWLLVIIPWLMGVAACITCGILLG